MKHTIPLSSSVVIMFLVVFPLLFYFENFHFPLPANKRTIYDRYGKEGLTGNNGGRGRRSTLTSIHDISLNNAHFQFTPAEIPVWTLEKLFSDEVMAEDKNCFLSQKTISLLIACSYF